MAPVHLAIVHLLALGQKVLLGDFYKVVTSDLEPPTAVNSCMVHNGRGKQWGENRASRSWE